MSIVIIMSITPIRVASRNLYLPKNSYNISGMVGCLDGIRMSAALNSPNERQSDSEMAMMIDGVMSGMYIEVSN